MTDQFHPKAATTVSAMARLKGRGHLSNVRPDSV
jgi:hypothetical protein